MVNIETIFSLIIPIIGYVFGELSKKFNWVEKKYLPLQTFIVGMLGAIIYYLTVDNSNFASAIVISFSSLIACGVYDLSKTKKEE